MKQVLLIDVCNLLHRIPAYRRRLSEGMDVLAEQLLGRLRPLHDLEHWELHLIVDGKGDRMEQQFPGPLRTLSIMYSPLHQQADTIIEHWLIHLGPDWRVSVASEDRAILHTALAHGAETLSARNLLDWVDRVQERYGRAQAARLKNSDHSFGNRLEGLP